MSAHFCCPALLTAQLSNSDEYYSSHEQVNQKPYKSEAHVSDLILCRFNLFSIVECIRNENIDHSLVATYRLNHDLIHFRWRIISAKMKQMKDCECVLNLFDRHIVVIGGVNTNTAKIVSCEVLSLDRNEEFCESWQDMPSTLHHRNSCSACEMKGRIFVCGGDSDNAVEMFTSARDILYADWCPEGQWTIFKDSVIDQYGSCITLYQGHLHMFSK